MKKLDVAGMDIRGKNGRGLDVADSQKASVDYFESVDRRFPSEYRGPASSAKHARELMIDTGRVINTEKEIGD